MKPFAAFLLASATALAGCGDAANNTTADGAVVTADGAVVTPDGAAVTPDAGGGAAYTEPLCDDAASLADLSAAVAGVLHVAVERPFLRLKDRYT